MDSKDTELEDRDGKIIEKRIKNNLIIRFLESLFSRLIITKKLLNLDKKIYEFMLWYTEKWQDWRLSENACKQRKYSISRSFKQW